MIKRMPIGIVDDDPRVLASLSDLLESAGFAVLVFDSAELFLQSGQLGSIECLISDISMPVTDGWDLERLLREARPELPVVLISAHDDAVQRGQAMLFDGRRRIILKKPFDGAALLGALKVLTA